MKNRDICNVKNSTDPLYTMFTYVQNTDLHSFFTSKIFFIFFVTVTYVFAAYIFPLSGHEAFLLTL